MFTQPSYPTTWSCLDPATFLPPIVPFNLLLPLLESDVGSVGVKLCLVGAAGRDSFVLGKGQGQYGLLDEDDIIEAFFDDLLSLDFFTWKKIS